MFNSYQYEKKVALNHEIDNIKKNYLKQRQQRKDENIRLSQNYKKRVENFVISMLENPITYQNYKSLEEYQFRDDQPQKYLGDAQIYVKGFKHEKDRILEAQQQNNSLDFLPNMNVARYQFRERDPTKDMKRDIFRYRDKTTLARIEQYLKDHTQTQVENQKLEAKKISNLENFSENMSSLEKKAYLAQLVAKNLLPSLHNKTHFQATQALYNNLPLSLIEHTKSQPNLNIQEETRRKSSIDKNKINQDDFHEEQGSNKVNEIETFNPIESSKYVLTKCNVIREKNPKIKTIHQGEGHLISTKDKSISDIYKELYHMEFDK